MAPVWSPVLAPLLEREDILAALHHALEQTRHGRRQVVFVSGEQGMGKSALVEAFLAQIRQRSGLWLASGVCRETSVAGEPYFPVLEALQELGQAGDSDLVVSLLRDKAPMWLNQLPAFLSASERETLARQVQSATPQRMLREGTALLEALTVMRPLVLVLENLHCSDAATLDLVEHLATSQAPARLLVLGTYRPEETGRQKLSIATVVARLGRQPLVLQPLTAAAVQTYLTTRYPGLHAPPELVTWLARRTEGLPLFLVAMLDDLRARHLLVEQDGDWKWRGDVRQLEQVVPRRLVELISQRVEALPEPTQRILEAGSVVGQAFAAEEVAACLDDGAVEIIDATCWTLAQRDFLLEPGEEAFWPDGTLVAPYGFRHALYQRVLYERIAPTRRRTYHRRFGEQLQARYGARAEEVAATLAFHFDRGGAIAPALQYYQRAAQRALTHAPGSAVAYLSRALELLVALPDTTARAGQELALCLTLGQALAMSQGFTAPDVESTYQRAGTLSLQMEQHQAAFQVTTGLLFASGMQGHFRKAHTFGRELLRLAHSQPHLCPALVAHAGLQFVWCCLGNLARATWHTQRGYALLTFPPPPLALSPLGVEAGVSLVAIASLLSWLRGYATQARAQQQELLQRAAALAHPFSEAFAVMWALFLDRLCNDHLAAQTRLGALERLSAEYGFPLWASGCDLWQGWIHTAQGQGSAGTQQMRRGLTAAQQLGTKQGVSGKLIFLAADLGQSGDPTTGLQVVDEALALIQTYSERTYVAEAYRLRGELLLQLPQRHTQQALARFQQALTLASRQGALALELRAAMSLYRLWQQHGIPEVADAPQVLARVYDRFTEGFDTADLRKARALLG